MNEPQKLLQEAAVAAAAQAAAAAAAAAVSGRSSSVSPAVTTSAATSNPYSALAAIAAASSAGSPTSPYLRPPLGATPFGSPAPPVTVSGSVTSADNSWLMSPLIQAALWQQQLQQRLSQIASMSGTPFMNPALAMASLGGTFPSPAAATAPPLPPLIPATTASPLTSENNKEVKTPTTSVGIDNVYREYLSKIVEGQGQKSAASEAAEVMANLIKASEDTNGNSKPKLFDMPSSAASALPVVSSIGMDRAALASAGALAGVDVTKPVLNPHPLQAKPRW